MTSCSKCTACVYKCGCNHGAHLGRLLVDVVLQVARRQHEQQERDAVAPLRVNQRLAKRLAWITSG